MGHKRELTNSLDRDNTRNFLEETRELQWERIISPDILRNRVVALLYSSGTTGIPKGVQPSHKNLVTQAVAMQAAIGGYLKRTNRRVHVDFHYRTIAHLSTTRIAELQGYSIHGIMAGETVF